MSLFFIYIVILLGFALGSYITYWTVKYLRGVEFPHNRYLKTTPTTMIIGLIEILLFFSAATYLNLKDEGIELPEGLFFVFIGWTALKFLGYSPSLNGSLGAQRRILIIGTLMNAIIGSLLGLLLVRGA